MINFQAPFNLTSIGQSGYNIFKEITKMTDVCLFPINGIGLECFELKDSDIEIIKNSLRYSKEYYNRNNPTLKYFHIRGSEDSVGRNPSLFTYHETNRLTNYEKNILSQQDKVFVSNRYTQSVFLDHNIQSIYAPLGFDSESFFEIEKREDEKEVLTFGLKGKLEQRKNTIRVIKAWVKVFGGDPRYRLDCSIHNAFMSNEEQSSMIINSLPDKRLPWNVNILPYSSTNSEYNLVLNNTDIELTGMSGGEGFNLPLFQSLCLGKQAIVLNAHAHKDYCNSSNSILIEPNGMVDAVDDRFFIEGEDINQGEWHDFKDSDLIDAMLVAAKTGRKYNHEGVKLKSWTYENTAKIILENLA